MFPEKNWGDKGSGCKGPDLLRNSLQKAENLLAILFGFAALVVLFPTTA